MIDSETIDKIFEAAKIEEVIGDFVELKKRGVNYLGRCPFHNEKTPSFTVSPDKQFFHCFGCQESGTAVGFIMLHDRLTFVEAIESLSNSVGVSVPREAGASRQELNSSKVLLDAIAKATTRNATRLFNL